MLTPNIEDQLLAQGYTRIVGIDEVGRGSWAGPLAVGAFIYQALDPIIAGVDDSKRLSANTRQQLASKLAQFEYTVKFVSVTELNQSGLQVSLTRAVDQLVANYNLERTLMVIDGRFKYDFGERTVQVIKADSTYYSVAAASILAKVERDKLMCELDQIYPGYGFAQHKGYGTKLHQSCLQKYGLTPIHRLSFAPIKKLSQTA